MEIIKEINIGKLHIEIKSQFSELIGIEKKGYEYTFEGISDESLLDEIVLNHIPNDVVSDEKRRIQKRKTDGIEAYQTTQAQLRLSRLSNGISDAIYTQYVYQPLDQLINYINGGNWLDAYNIINDIQINPYLSSQMLLSFKLQIANYIVGDGEYLEYLGKSVDNNGNIII